YRGEPCAFFDYTVPGSASEPVAWVPRVEGPGTVTIRNGVIKSAARGILSWGVQSTAQEVKVILDNVQVISQGINTNAVDVPQAVITDCRFDIDTPFIINRHVSEHAVVLRGSAASEVSYSEFFGGQGCLNFLGENSVIHHNLFVNRQTVTNHYCIMARGDGSKIFANRLEPEIGSGIEIFRHNRIDIFDNEFHIEAAPPSCEYGHEEYSTTAIRIADYNARPGAPDGCSDNRIYANRMYITGRDYPQYPDYIPMAWAIFYSASGGQNYVIGNDIMVTQRNPGSKAEASAFYVGGGSIGGVFRDNRLTANVPVAWIGNPYGEASGTLFERNLIVRSAEAPAEFKPFRMGFAGRDTSLAHDIQFRSNEFSGCSFGLDATAADHSYSVYWTLAITVKDRDGKPLPEAEVEIADRRGASVSAGKTNASGIFSAELMEYSIAGNIR
ncbi:MAG TPA: Ig-like domain-containing protein, partial [Candidatus Glassbacteria bacterium]|nr:Ig-like domain-containing protein [Candidatus Glassbacteria bacterium]